MYTAPYIDSSGLHIPTYQDILDDLIDQAKTIFGADIYLGNDSLDYQLLSVFALKTYDSFLALQLSYNSRSPVTAVGSGLDAVVKLNGLERKSASYSTCTLTIVGTAGTVINNGVAQDVNSYKWDLPAVVTIPVGGSISVTGTCETIGAIQATAGTITTIATPTAGWTSVTNSAAATQGQEAEEDSILRARQAESTKLPSLTLFDGTIAAIAALSGVTRYQVYENYTNIVDANGLDPHSIWAIVEGGTDQAVAEAIYYNKSMGCGVNGTTTVAVVDSEYGTTANIKFSRPNYVTIYVEIEVHLLTGGTSAHLAAIQTAIEDYLDALQIGEDLTISGLYGAAMATMTNLYQPVFSIRALRAGTSPSPIGTSDIAIAFNEVTQAETSPESVTVIEV